MARRSVSAVQFWVKESGFAPELGIAIDGVELVESVLAIDRQDGDGGLPHGGLMLDAFPSASWTDMLLGAAWAPGRVLLLGCGGCGEWGCWPFWARIRVDAGIVAWHDLTGAKRPQRSYATLEPLVFDEAAYRGSVGALQLEVLRRGIGLPSAQMDAGINGIT